MTCSVISAFMARALKNFLEQLGVHLTDLRTLERHVPGEEWPAGDVHRGLRKRLVHRDQRGPNPPYAALVAQRLGEGLAENDADILGGMVEVDVQIVLGAKPSSRTGRGGPRGQHVVEKADASRNLCPSQPSSDKVQADIGFRGCPALDFLRGPCRQHLAWREALVQRPHSCHVAPSARRSTAASKSAMRIMVAAWAMPKA